MATKRMLTAAAQRSTELAAQDVEEQATAAPSKKKNKSGKSPMAKTATITTTTNNAAASEIAASDAPLKTIWDCPKIVKCKVNKKGEDKDGWKCGWCGLEFVPVHATRAQWHVLKMSQKGVVICKGIIPDAYHQRYLSLHNKSAKKISQMPATPKAKEMINAIKPTMGESSNMSQTDKQLTLQNAIEKTTSTIEIMEKKVEELRVKKHDAETNEADKRGKRKRVKKLEEKISLKEDMIKTYEATLRSYMNNLNKVNREGDNE